MKNKSEAKQPTLKKAPKQRGRPSSRGTASAAEFERDLTLFTTLINNSNDGVFIIDPATSRILYANDRTCKDLRYPREELLTMTILDISMRTRTMSAWQQSARMIKREGFALFETEHRRKDGTTFFLEVHARHVEHGEREYLIAIARDITERKRTEAALKSDEMLLKGIIESLPFDCFAIDKSGRYSLLNSTAVRHWGNVVGKRPEDIAAGSPHGGRWMDNNRRAFAGETVQGEVEYLFDGMPHTIREIIAPIRDHQQQVQGILGINIDVTAQKQYEKALRESEEKYKFLIETTNTGYVIIDNQGRVVDANQEYVRLTGHLGLDEIFGRNVVEWTAKHDLDRNAEEVRKCVERGFVRNLEIDYVNKEGRITPVEINATVLRTPGFERILTLCRDITKRKKTEALMRQGLERLQVLINRMPMACIMWSPEFRAELWNPAAERIFGYAAHEIIGKHPYGLIVPAGAQPHVDVIWRRLLEGDTTAHSENENITKDGRVILCEWSNTPIRADDGRVVAVLSLVQDVTERKQAEEAARKSREILEKTFLSLDSALFILDNGKPPVITDCNPAATKIFGYQKEEMLGRTTAFLHVNEQMLAEFQQRHYAAVEQQGFLSSLEFRMKRCNGEIFPTEHSVFPLLDDLSSRIGWVSVLKDITDRRRAEEEKQKLQSQLLQAQKMEAVGQLAGGIAHDFNNILTAIIGYGNVALMSMGEESPLRPYIDQILSAAERAAGLTQSLLAFSRKQIINPQPASVNAIIERVQKLLHRIIGEDIELKTFLTKDDTTVLADTGQIEQILINVATNARDAMPNGGQLTIETGHAEIDDEYIRVHGYGKKGDYVLVSFTDTGTGMDEQTRQRVFEPFFTTKEVGKGTGLGLSIVYGSIKQHNGYINVYSEPRRGTMFKIYLPLFADAARPVSAPDPVPPPRGGTETVLLAEDDAPLRSLTKGVLQDFGYTVIEAADGQDAIRKLQDNLQIVQLLILDVIMPKKNGKEVFEEAARLKPGVKALFTSGYPADIIQKKGIIEEGLAFIAKPLRPQELLRKVREVLDA